MSSENATKWLRGVVIAGLGVAGASFIGYVMEHGELPEWMPKVFNWVWSGVTVPMPWALWQIMIPVSIIGGIAAYFLQSEGQKIIRLEDLITAIQQQLKKVKAEKSELLAENNRLKLPPPREPEQPSQPTFDKSQQEIDERMLSAVVGPTFASGARLIGQTTPTKLGVTVASLMTVSQLIDKRDSDILDVIRICTKNGNAASDSEICDYVSLKQDDVKAGLRSLSDKGYIKSVVVYPGGGGCFQLAPKARLHFKKIEQGEASEL